MAYKPQARTHPTSWPSSLPDTRGRPFGSSRHREPGEEAPHPEENIVSRIGAGITLIVVGLVLTFALRVDVPGVGEYALGLILVLAGAVLLVLHFVLLNQRQRSHTVVEERPRYVEEVVEEEPVVERRRRRRY